jgi:RNA polymerase sigma factor (sigma-70 family)
MALIQHLRRAAFLSADLSDGQLLEYYLTRGEDAAFEALVRRHGPMVLGVCRRVLRNEHDAEDAFQASFLVLLRKASSVLPRDRVGNWLYGVAYRTSLKAKALRAKRRAKERRVTRPETDSTWLELLDYELNRLPDKYREPVVLCCLQGKTRREAARLLGWPEGTVATRLATARRILAKRLGSSMAIPVASIPPLLVASTVRSAAAGQVATSANVAALTGAVLKGMIMGKVKIAISMVIVLSAIGLGAGAGSYKLLAGEEERKALPTEKKAAATEPTSEEGRLPIGDPPIQALVSLSNDGRLAVRRLSYGRREIPLRIGVDGQTIPLIRYEHVMSTSRYDLSEIEVLDSKGKKVDKGRLPGLLKEEIPALTYSGREEPDRLHFRVIKDGILVFLLPSQDRLIARAFSLKKASAARVANLLSNYYNQRYKNESAAQKHIRISHDDKSNTLIVTAAPTDLEEIHDLIERIDNAMANGQVEPDVRVGEVLIVGNEGTATDLILKAIQLTPGQILSDSDLKKAEQNLKRLDLFESATVTVVENLGNFKNVLVTVKEK